MESLEDRYLLSAGFLQINLDSDLPGIARVLDPNLVNPWGMAFSPTGGFWFGDNGAGVSDVVDGAGQLLPVVVAVPGSGGSIGRPTGTVYNDGAGFQITANGVTAPAHFLFASEDGTISAWSPRVDNASALVVIDNAALGAVYKGLALATGADGQSYLFAADFGRGEIDVFDQNFHPVTLSGAFTDPNLPSGFAPFNVQTINGQLFVTYAKKAAGSDDDGAGAGNGFIDVYSPSGRLVERLASGGALDSPWGMAVAPQSFGPFAGALLVGNEGDGHINAYDLHSGAYLGPLTDSAGNPLAIEGLWGLTVGNDHLAGNSQTLFFAAGIDHEQHGLFGGIQFTQGGPSDTGGALPYDPSSNDDDYPLPPAQGPTLGANSGQLGPSPVLLSASTSSFALAPTLSIATEFSESQTAVSLVAALSSPAPGTMPNAANPVVALGTVTGTGTMPTFVLSPPEKLITTNQPSRQTAGLVGSNASSETSPPLSLLLQDNKTPADSAVEESTHSSTSPDSNLHQAREVSFASSWPSDYLGFVGYVVHLESGREPIAAFSTPDSRLAAATMGSILDQIKCSLTKPLTLFETKNDPGSLHISPMLRGSLFVVAAWLHWAGKSSKPNERERFSTNSQSLLMNQPHC